MNAVVLCSTGTGLLVELKHKNHAVRRMLISLIKYGYFYTGIKHIHFTLPNIFE